MTQGLVRYQTAGHTHFVTFSCFRRLPHLQTPAAKHLFENALERTRIRYGLYLYGYVVMPEHVRQLAGDPRHHLYPAKPKAGAPFMTAPPS